MPLAVCFCRSKSLCYCLCEPDPGSVFTLPHTVKKIWQSPIWLHFDTWKQTTCRTTVCFGPRPASVYLVLKVMYQTKGGICVPPKNR